MARTQIYPGATKSSWYQDNYPGNRMDANGVVWHSTEGRTLPTYGGGVSAPTITAVPDFKAERLVWHQHYDVDVSARALVNQRGGVETNTLNVAQVEIVGTCDPATHKKWGSSNHLYMAELPDWAIRDLAAFSKWLRDEHGVPLVAPHPFKAYPGSYGATDNRMTYEEWFEFKGHCGHQHVPENDHGDPGTFPIAAILAAAGAVKPDPKPPVPPAGLPTVSLSHAQAAARRDPGLPQGGATHRAEVKLIEQALDKLNYLAPEWVDGSYGTKTIEAYAKLQRHLGYTGSDADGRPGSHSLTWLGQRSGLFRKVA